MSDNEHRPDEERHALLTAAVRLLLAERNWGADAVPEDDEQEARDALALAARAYVLALNAHGTRLWKMEDAESLRVETQRLTEEVTWMRATIDRNNNVIKIWADYHANVHPLPEDVREQIVAAMHGAEPTGTDALLSDARAVALLCKDVLQQLPVGLDEILGVEWEELPDWFTGDAAGREMWGGS